METWKQNFVAVDVVNFDRTAKEKLRKTNSRQRDQSYLGICICNAGLCYFS